MTTVLQYKLFISDTEPLNNIPGTIWIDKTPAIAHLMINAFIQIASPTVAPTLEESTKILTVIFSSTEPIGATVGQIWVQDD